MAGPFAGGTAVVRACRADEVDTIFEIVNDAASAYRGIIPADRWHEPYMPLPELQAEIAAGVLFSGVDVDGVLAGVMGLQHVGDVALIRHAYTRTAFQGHGYGAALLRALCAQTDRPMLVGTWAAATWAIAFYEHHGFRLVSAEDKPVLLRRYWTVPERQIETSVVLGDARWFSR